MKMNLAPRRSASFVPLHRRFAALALLAALAAGTPLALSTAQAQTSTSAVPAFLSYQGRVTTPAGALVGAGTPVNRTVTFRIWSHATNSLAADLIYSEQQVATISEGEFSVLVGQGSATSGTPLGYSETTKGKPSVTIADAGVFGGAVRYLGVTVDDGNSGTIDPEISPRQQIVTAAFAFRAKYAESLGANGVSSVTTLDNGNVGIGNTNPQFKLEIGGNVSSSGSIAASGTSGFIFRTGDTDGGLFSPADDTIAIRTNAAERVRVTSGGLSLLTGTMSSSGYSFIGPGDTDGGMFSAEDGVVTFRTNATEKMRIDPSGRVGIGVTPAYTLHVRSDTPEILVGKSDATGGALYFGNPAHGVKRGWGTTGTQPHDIGMYTSGADLYLSANGAVTTQFVLKNNGNTGLGLGAAIPGEKLAVGGNVRATGSNAGFQVADAGNVTRATWSAANGAANFSTDAAVNDVVLRAESGSKLLLQSNTGASAIAITSNNLVGIGIAAPTEKFHVNGGVYVNGQLKVNQGIKVTSGVAAHEQGTHIEWNKFGTGNSFILNQKGLGIGGLVFGEVDSGNGITTRMEIQSNGYTRFDARVGIFNSDPQANLHVTGSTSSTFYLDAYIDGNGASPGPNGNSTQAHSIISDARVRASAFDVMSDARIKHVLGRSAGAPDLATLMQIAVTDYTFKDTLEHGDRAQKKVIAQELEAIFPQAVNRSVNYVPDIFQKAALKDGWVELATDLKVGERVRLGLADRFATYDVREVAPGRFRPSTVPAGDTVFVYGRVVTDFRSVDYEAVAMLNVSATQQLKRDTDAEVKSLRAENAALRTELAALAAKEAARDAKLVSLEKLLRSTATVMARPAAPKSAGTLE